MFVDRRSGSGGKREDDAKKRPGPAAEAAARQEPPMQQPEPVETPPPQSPPEVQASRSQPPAPEPVPPAGEPEPPGGEAAKPDFLGLTQIFFLQTMVALGQGQDPNSGQAPEIDMNLARQQIGILELLKEKTEGNLSGMESKYLTECLHQARLAYVALAQGQR